MQRELKPCRNCGGVGWVCENHTDAPWGGASSHPDACECGAGAPCPCCRPEMVNAGLIGALHKTLWMADEWFEHLGSGSMLDDDYRKDLAEANRVLEFWTGGPTHER